MSKSKLKLVLVATVVALAITFLGLALLTAMNLVGEQSDLINLMNYNK
jgi:hypothetical protein